MVEDLSNHQKIEETGNSQCEKDCEWSKVQGVSPTRVPLHRLHSLFVPQEFHFLSLS